MSSIFTVNPTNLYFVHSSIYLFFIMYKWLLKSSLPPDIVNKVLWEHSHSHLFPNGLWLVFTTAEMSSGDRDQYDLKIFTVWTFINIVFQLWTITQSPIDDYSGCFQYGICINNVSLNLCNLLTLTCAKVSLDYMLRSGFQGLKRRNIFNSAFPPTNCISVLC